MLWEQVVNKLVQLLKGSFSKELKAKMSTNKELPFWGKSKNGGAWVRKNILKTKEKGNFRGASRQL